MVFVLGCFIPVTGRERARQEPLAPRFAGGRCRSRNRPWRWGLLSEQFSELGIPGPNSNLGCSHQLREEIFLDSYSSSLDGYIHFLIYNPGPSPTTLADIYIDNSNVNFTLSPSSGTGSGCSETTRVVGPSAHCIVSAPAPDSGSTAHSVVIVTALGSTFRFNITVSS